MFNYLIFLQVFYFFNYFFTTLMLFVLFRQNSQSRENINFPEDEGTGTAEGERGTEQPSISASPGTSCHCVGTCSSNSYKKKNNFNFYKN